MSESDYRYNRNLFLIMLLIIYFISPGCGKDIPDEVRVNMFNAIDTADIETVRTLIRQYPSIVSIRDKYGATPLHRVAASGKLPLAELLVNNGAPVNAVSIHGWTPLHKAAYAGCIEMTSFLIGKGAQIDARDQQGYTPLHYAVVEKKPEIATLLIENGAQVNVAGGRGETPLHYAMLADSDELAAILLKNGADEDARNNDGDTPVDFAEKSGNSNAKAMMKRLVNTNVNNGAPAQPVQKDK